MVIFFVQTAELDYARTIFIMSMGTFAVIDFLVKLSFSQIL